MNKVTTFLLIAIFSLSLRLSAQTPPQTIHWMSITEAEKLNAEHPRKILIDIYTDWCGWCKKLDATTYKDPKIVQYLNDNFYAVKLNAESKDPITFQNQEYTYDPARRVNGVTANFMNSSSGYPTTTFLNEKLEVISVVPGYMQAEMMTNVLTFFAENHYLTTDWKTYLASIGQGAK